MTRGYGKRDSFSPGPGRDYEIYEAEYVVLEEDRYFPGDDLDRRDEPKAAPIPSISCGNYTFAGSIELGMTYGRMIDLWI